MNEVVEQMMMKYNLKSSQDYENALKEILQEVILLGLARNGFFEKAAFYGGTALRILHGLDRFSEDLDFTLFRPEASFNFDKYFSGLERELKSFGFDCTIQRVNKAEERTVESAFLKTNTQILFLNVQGAKALADMIQKNQMLKIKFEVDVDPAIAFDTESKTILLPSPFSIKALTLPSLFAGKMHAVLFRKWKTRVKGRDFYDFQWYMARNIPLKKSYLEEKMRSSGVLSESLTKDLLISFFEKRVDSIDWESAKQDVLGFLKNKDQVRLWSPTFFKEIIQKINLV
jgi:predicted nucleotidyltransferase component of viral defense system